MKLSFLWHHFGFRSRLQYLSQSLWLWLRRFVCRLKYCLVHITARTMVAVKNGKTQMTIQYVSYVPELILVIALGMGLYTQWSLTQDAIISAIAILGAFIFAVSCAFRYYFGQEDLGKALFHIWVGLLLGIIAFTNNPQAQYFTLEEVMEAMFMTSMVLGWCWNVLECLLKLRPLEAQLLTISEGLESLGLIIASLVTTVDSIALSLITLAYIFHISAMKLKSTMGFLSFIAFIFVGIFLFFPALQVKPNIYALTCFVGRHAFRSVIDFYFCGLSMIDRWRPLFGKARLMRYLCVILMFIMELVLAVVIGFGTSRHKEWYIVLPVYLVLAIFWLMFHFMSFITCWKLMGKITECNASADERRSFNRIMSAKGLRYFGLVSQRIIFLSLVTTIVVFAVGYETRTPYTLAMVFLVLPVEAAVVSLFWELGDNLGGTCTGYAVIAPVTSLKQGKGAQLLANLDVLEISTRGTSTLSELQQLFNYHMIQNFGCDYSSSGLELESLQNKMKAFFDRRTSDGPRFDTYLLYYSGDVYETGDWALADNKSLTLSMILGWFREKDNGSGSRLILVLDTVHSYLWAQNAQYVDSCFLAVQTCRYIMRSESAEIGEKFPVGTFTRAYVQFNNEQEVDIDWLSRTRPIRALYKVSSHWSDFSFHLPTREDVESYWRTNFHPAMKPLMKCLNLPDFGSPFCCCRCVFRWFRWLQMMWLPPRQLDTGHGFQLLST
uniref:Transmembrane protein 168 n=1 Tax=Arion vulgaris TaxID=1028688 RepID=A0A0B6YSN7_9EUPU